MNRKSLPALVALNVVLLIAVVLITLTPQPVQAQFGRSSFLMISGEVVGQRQRNVVYIIDTSTAKMITVMFNSANDKLEIIAGRDLAQDFKGPLQNGGKRGGR
jgi:hypothetical protein